MQINLKQTEITEALRQYVAQKGIDLAGKTVDIAFTAGRKEGGLTAEINIDDQAIPGFGTGSDEPVQLSLVSGSTAEPADQPAEATVGEPVAEGEVTSSDAPKTTSLFS